MDVEGSSAIMDVCETSCSGRGEREEEELEGVLFKRDCGRRYKVRVLLCVCHWHTCVSYRHRAPYGLHRCGLAAIINVCIAVRRPVLTHVLSLSLSLSLSLCVCVCVCVCR